MEMTNDVRNLLSLSLLSICMHTYVNTKHLMPWHAVNSASTKCTCSFSHTHIHFTVQTQASECKPDTARCSASFARNSPPCKWGNLRDMTARAPGSRITRPPDDLRKHSQHVKRIPSDPSTPLSVTERRSHGLKNSLDVVLQPSVKPQYFFRYCLKRVCGHVRCNII